MRKKEDQNPELAKLKRKLETAEEYAGNAAHELKSPLASMKVLADAFRKKYTGNFLGISVHRLTGKQE